MKLLLPLLTFLHVPVFAATFSKSEILFPVGKAEIQKFLDLLKDPANEEEVKFIEVGNVHFQEIPEEKSAIATMGSSHYLLYWDDFNNDGEKEYFLIYVQSGSGNYSGIQGAYSLRGRKLESMHVDDIIIKNLFPGKDLSRFHSYLARPFAVRKNGKTYLRFLDGPKDLVTRDYIWSDKKFSKANLL